jgi:hypothetical protein
LCKFKTDLNGFSALKMSSTVLQKIFKDPACAEIAQILADLNTDNLPRQLKILRDMAASTENFYLEDTISYYADYYPSLDLEDVKFCVQILTALLRSAE